MKKLFLAAIFAIGLAGTGFSQAKIAHLDYVKVQDTLPSYKTAVKEMEDLATEAQTELKKLEDNYLAIQKEIMAAGDLSALAQERAQKRLATAGELYEMTEQSYQSDMRKLQNRLIPPIQETIEAAISVVAKKMGLNYVLDKGNTHYADGQDITNAVITEALKLDKQAKASN
jgi:Skp family chaperone for outer membrane proteins